MPVISMIKCGEHATFFVTPATAQCRIIWFSISEPFTPEDLPKVAGSCSSVTYEEVQSHGYEKVALGPFYNKTYHFREKTSPEESHPSLLFVRVWEQSPVFAQRERRMSAEVLAESCLWDALVPKRDDLKPKLISWLVTPAPMS